MLVTKGKESDPTLHAAAHSQTVLTVEVAVMNESYPEMRDELQDEVSNGTEPDESHLTFTGITCIGIKAGTSVFAMEPSITVAIAEPRQIRADGTNLWTFNYTRYDIGRLQPIFFPLSVNESRDYNATVRIRAVFNLRTDSPRGSLAAGCSHDRLQRHLGGPRNRSTACRYHRRSQGLCPQIPHITSQ